MVCNLQQNPTSRPIISTWLPALLKQGTMYLVKLTGNSGKEERWLLDSEPWNKEVIYNYCSWTVEPCPTCLRRNKGSNETGSKTKLTKSLVLFHCQLSFSCEELLHSMGQPQFESASSSSSTYPVPLWDYKPPSTAMRRMAGNVNWVAIMDMIMDELFVWLKFDSWTKLSSDPAIPNLPSGDAWNCSWDSPRRCAQHTCCQGRAWAVDFAAEWVRMLSADWPVAVVSKHMIIHFLIPMYFLSVRCRCRCQSCYIAAWLCET